MIGPILSGVMTEHANWQSFWWLNVGLFCVLIILIVFCFPETKFTARAEKPLMPESDQVATDTTAPGKTNGSATDVDEVGVDPTKSPQPAGTEAETAEPEPALT